MDGPGSVVAVVVAAGRGARMGGGPPKQFTPLAGVPMAAHSLDALSRAPSIRSIVLVVPADDPGPGADLAAAFPRVRAVVPGGATRQESVAAGLGEAPDAEIVVVHDAARPLVSPGLVEAVVAAARDVGAAVPALPVTDTLKEVSGDLVRATVDRERLVAVQTPQAFRADWLRRAHGAVGVDAPATDDAALLEALGLPVQVVPGEPENLKVTRAADLERAALAAGPKEDDVRVGTGFDAHRFDPDRPLVLGGVRFPGEPGLAGHSDADVVCHALIDALLGPAGLGDCGSAFPDSDPGLAGADSLGLLGRATAMVRDAGLRVVNVDVVVIAERPRLSPRIPEMRARLGEALGVSADRVSLKGTTTEGMGFTGRGEGIACQAVALLEDAAP